MSVLLMVWSVGESKVNVDANGRDGIAVAPLLFAAPLSVADSAWSPLSPC